MLKEIIVGELKKLFWKMLTTVVLTLTAGVTLWVYAAFVEPAAGPASSLQDFAQNILGADNSDNSFSSSNVAANNDGSIIERQEYQTGLVGTSSDSASMSSTLFAGQQSIYDQDSTTLSRVGTSSDSASMSSTLFAGQEYLYGRVDNSYSACYERGAYSGTTAGGSYPSCSSGFTSILTYWDAVGANSAGTLIYYNDYSICCLSR